MTLFVEKKEKDAAHAVIKRAEAMARHKGSVFGALGEERQPSSEQLRRATKSLSGAARNDLATLWSRLSADWVFLEDL